MPRCGLRSGVYFNPTIMKKILMLITLVVISQVALAQSRSFDKLREKFAHEEDVHTFKMGGFMLHVVLNLMTKDDASAKQLANSVNHIRLMVIPQRAFDHQGLTVSGFRNILRQDDFEQMAEVRKGKETVTVYVRPDNNHLNRYFVLVSDQDEVVAMEMKGNVDPEWLAKNNFVKASAR
jgi:hypothetical protein